MSGAGVARGGPEERPGVPRLRPGAIRPNLKDVIADHVRSLILSGALRPGDRIPQDGIAEALAVSRLPVREALIALASEGLIVNEPRRGSFVARLTVEDVLDHFMVVGLLSGVAAERAAGRLSPEQLDELDRLCDAMEAETDPRLQEELNGRFHALINRAGSSLRLRSLLRDLSRSIPSDFFSMPTGWREWGGHDHRRIVAALRSGDGAEAARVSREHLLQAGTIAVDGLRAVGFWDADGGTVEAQEEGSRSRR